MPERNEAIARRLSMSRLIAAPRERVFAAWTDPTQLVQWCYLTGMENRHTEINPVAGGNWTISLRTAEGMDIFVRRVYREINPPSRLVFYEQCNAGGNIILDGVHTVEFEPAGDKTRITVSVELKDGFDAENQRGWNGGWGDLFDHLGTFLGRPN
jgi:uncharacterized protein YndB with AHSA1/START domain